LIGGALVLAIASVATARAQNNRRASTLRSARSRRLRHWRAFGAFGRMRDRRRGPAACCDWTLRRRATAPV